MTASFITSVAAMMLVSGQLELDKPVAIIFQNYETCRFMVKATKIQCAQYDSSALMNHTSALLWIFSNTPVDKMYQNAAIVESKQSEND